MTGPDPRSPLVLDTRALGLQRRPGSMVEFTRTVPGPPDLGVALARVPTGSEIELDLRLESVMEGVLVSGTAELSIEGECARCLEPVSWNEEIDLSELFVYPATDHRGAVVDEPGPDDDPLPTIEDDLIDLEPTLRDAVVLSLPLSPVCRTDCPGLCPECGFALAQDPRHAHERIDPRWSALAELREQANDTPIEE